MNKIANLSAQQLETLASNHRLGSVDPSCRFTHSDVLLEQRLRIPSEFSDRELAVTVSELSEKSTDGFVTYNDVWHTLRPNTPWKGHATLRIVTISLRRLVGYCVRNHLPILPVLVVRSDSHQLSDKAVLNIFNECKELGYNTGLNAKQFVARQTKEARTLCKSGAVLELAKA